MSCLWFERLWGRTNDLFVFLLVSRVGNIWQGSVTGSGIGPASSVSKSVHMVSVGPGFDSRVGHIFSPASYITKRGKYRSFCLNMSLANLIQDKASGGVSA